VSGGPPVRARALVCEDEPIARRALREYLSGVDWVEIVGEAVNGLDAVRLVHKLEPDLVFLDVRMPGLTGLEVLDALTHRPAVVFTTAHDEYAVSAFEVGAVDYLVKPFGRARLLETLARVRVRLLGEGLFDSGGPTSGPARVSGYTQRVFARRGAGFVPVSVPEIVRVDATVGGVTLQCGDGDFEMDCTLGELERRLDPTDFVRVHRSHLVNLNHVHSVRRYDERRLEVRLEGGSSIVASRQGSKALKEVMEP
jgi:two-component system LytT family response regulator